MTDEGHRKDENQPLSFWMRFHKPSDYPSHNCHNNRRYNP
jgi:hypothetical protein